MTVNSEVQQAIQAITLSSPASTVTSREDGQGGAWVTVDPVFVGDQWEPSTTWITFHISYLTPAVDVYPHYVRADLHRKDGGPLSEALHQNQPFGPEGRELGVMISRRTTAHTPQNTPAVKLAKVLEWMQER